MVNRRPTFFKSQSDLRKWFKKNHEQKKELWVGFYGVKSGEVAATYKEALDEALCFGWIDGIRKSINANSYTSRFTPRRARSYWSEVNTKRFRELQRLGRVHLSGLKVFNEWDKNKIKLYSFENKAVSIDGAMKKKFKANRKAWEFFQAQPPYYKKVFTRWVIGAKQEETRHRRLEALMKASAKGLRLDMLSPFSKSK